MTDSIYIIAEAGVNHNGDVSKAFELVDAAVDAGVNAIKFQTFKATKLVTKKAEKAGYQKKSTSADESQQEMLKKLELSFETHIELKKYCENSGIEFLSTAFDFESLKFLTDDLRLKTLKISSGDLTNGPFLLAHANTGCSLILSTGMATMGEIEEALSVLAYGYLMQETFHSEPSREAFFKAYASDKGQQILKEKLTLLHCTSEYPAPIDEVNLRAIETMRECFKLEVGYSDHTKGIVIPIAASALGANVIEKHFTLDKSLPGPDHQASLDPAELKDMVKGIRSIEQARGSGIKVPTSSELKNKAIARKSLVASQAIQQGEALGHNNMTIKRPGSGISPMNYWQMLGKKTDKQYQEEELI